MTDAYSEAVKKYTEPGQIFEFKEVTNDKGITYREFCNPATVSYTHLTLPTKA